MLICRKKHWRLEQQLHVILHRCTQRRRQFLQKPLQIMVKERL